MKTAEDILYHYESFVKHSDIPIFLKENVLKAMEEFMILKPMVLFFAVDVEE